jgi:2-polyprenyl-6-methoxyphenol hydroxylase-like FAD-dependent oxidoreductase
MMNSARKVAIVGGGPGGLAAARALHAIGLEVVVVERSAEDNRAGVCITVWPNGTQALERLGVLGAVRSQSAEISALAIRTDRDRLLFELRLNSESLPPYPSLALIRQAMIDCLRDGLQATIIRGNAVGFLVENGRVKRRISLTLSPSLPCEQLQAARSSSRYFPVSQPLARGVQAMTPSSNACAMGKISRSTSRSMRLYST